MKGCQSVHEVNAKNGEYAFMKCGRDEEKASTNGTFTTIWKKQTAVFEQILMCQEYLS